MLLLDKSDEDIAKMIAKTQNPDCFEILVNRYQNDVYRRALAVYTGDKDKATELAINIFVTLWGKLLTKDYTTPIRRWLLSQTMLICVEKYRELCRTDT